MPKFNKTKLINIDNNNNNNNKNNNNERDNDERNKNNDERLKNDDDDNSDDKKTREEGLGGAHFAIGHSTAPDRAEDFIAAHFTEEEKDGFREPDSDPDDDNSDNESTGSRGPIC